MSRERGLALVSVLWGVAILSLIAAAMLSASVTTATIGRNTWNATRAGNAADTAVNRAILALLDDRAQRQPRVDGTPVLWRFNNLGVKTWVQDESGKINLNVAPKELLQGLFVSGGMSASDAGALADRVVARRGPQDTLSPKATFRAAEDLLAVPGMTREVFDRIAPALTVYGHTGAVNQQVAPREALRALPNMGDDVIDRLFKNRDAAHAAALANGMTGGGALGAANSDFRITVEVFAPGAHVVRVAVVQFTGDATKPYLILDWR